MAEIACWAEIWYSTLKCIPENMEECTDKEKDEIFDELIFDETTSMCFENEDNEYALENPNSAEKKG